MSTSTTIGTRENTGNRKDLQRSGFRDVTVVTGRIKMGSAKVRLFSLPSAGVANACRGRRLDMLLTSFTWVCATLGDTTKCGWSTNKCNK
jgi:hypothetical protein